MSKISGYGINTSSFYKSVVKSKEKEETKKADKAEKSEKKTPAQLSAQAKKLLDELKKKYSNMDFIVADYENEEEAASYLSRGTKEFSVLIEPETLEEMAADEDAKAKYTGIIEDSTGQLKDMADKLGDKKDEVTHMGVSIGKDGSVSYFAELERMGEKQKEWIEKNIESRREERAAKEKDAQANRLNEKKAQENQLYEMTQTTRVQADSVEELLEKINAVDWNQIKAQEKPEEGGRFDFSV